MLKMLESSGKTYEALIEEWRPDVERALKSRLIVESLIKDQGIDVAEAEMENEMATMAAGMEVPVEEVKKHYEQENMKEYLRDDIRDRKLYDLLIGESKIKTGKKMKYLDLLGKN
jgi:trigger factor